MNIASSKGGGGSTAAQLFELRKTDFVYFNGMAVISFSQLKEAPQSTRNTHLKDKIAFKSNVSSF
jgi:hypothetical protein